ncbi:His/Gly/Thr/Pro-type tRNA ligase C-terminal domain-containing protein, partial [Turicimonas muris]
YDKSEAVREKADTLYNKLKADGVDVILDDRGLRPGVMFADWELIGVPHRITIGDKGLKDGVVEYTNRRDMNTEKVSYEQVEELLKEKLKY